MPKVAEVDPNGIQLREMNKILLKKIEELILHLIRAEEQAAVQEKRIKELEIRF